MEEFRNMEKEDQVIELQCNLDDTTGEDLAYAMDILLEHGALEVFTVPIGMKKGRTGLLLTVLCKVEQRKEMAKLIFQHTTTIGIREHLCNRMILERREIEMNSDLGMVRIKQSAGYGVVKEKREFEDLKAIAKREQMSLSQVRAMLSQTPKFQNEKN